MSQEQPTKQYEVLARGTAIVRMEPRGDHGMEGFALDDRIVFELVQQYRTEKKHYRVYPPHGDGWYDTCGPNVFNQYFTKEEDIHDRPSKSKTKTVAASRARVL